eukprot:scaffold22642_cov134-Cylindrotheca_fusiformis.AAC.29
MLGWIATKEEEVCLSCYKGGGGLLSRGRAFQRRSCVNCGDDIHERPESHTQCLSCYKGGGLFSHGRTFQRRSCVNCGDDIHDRPESHTQCLSCYKGEGGLCSRGRTPESHTQCLSCYRGVGSASRKRAFQRRSCVNRGDDIRDRPASHTQCLKCYSGGGSSSQEGAFHRSRKRRF